MHTEQLVLKKRKIYLKNRVYLDCTLRRGGGAPQLDMTEKQWQLVEALIPRQNRRGRRRQDDRQVLNGILWVLRTGESWRNLPSRYPPYQTCHRRFQEWRQQGTLARILETLARNP